MKDQILQIKSENPNLGYKAIAKIVGCAPTLVRYYLNPNYQQKKLKQQVLYRAELSFKIKQHFGGKCSVCKYDRCMNALCFHHRDPKTKVDTVAQLIHDSSWENILVEATKCVLLCCRCHAEVHAGLLTV